MVYLGSIALTHTGLENAFTKEKARLNGLLSQMVQLDGSSIATIHALLEGTYMRVYGHPVFHSIRPNLL